MPGSLFVNRGITILVSILVGLGACGGSQEETQSVRAPAQEELEAVWQEAQPIIEDELAKEEARSAVRFPCTLFDKAAAADLLGAEVEAPAFAHEFKNSSNIDTGENNAWQAEACSWSNRGDGASLNIWVSRPEHFKDGHVSCYGIYDEDTTEGLLGGQAKWEFLESFGWAKLLVCRDDALVFVEINDGPVEETAAKSIAMEIASRVTATL